MQVELQVQLDLFKNLKNNFKSLSSSRNWSFEDVHEYSFGLVTHANSTKKFDVFLSGLIHGNEVGGISTINGLLDFVLKKPETLKTNILFHLSNIEAAKKGERFLEKDLNRSFFVNSTVTHEDRLARMIESLVTKCTYNLDLHQTNIESKTPFFIFSYSQDSLNWARFLNSEIPAITSNKERHKDGSTLDFFCLKNNIPSVTLELGKAGFDSKQTEFGIRTLLKILNLKQIPQSQFSNMYKVLESLYWDTDRILLKEGFVNFDPIHKNDVIGEYQISKKPYLSQYDGYLLFPKYGKIAEKTKEVVTFAVPIQSVEEL